MAGINNATFLSNVSAEWVESLYAAWQKDADSVPQEWRIFFSGYELGIVKDQGLRDETWGLKHSAVQSLIYRYRDMGHLLACTDPLSPCRPEYSPLELSAFGLNETDLETIFTTRRFMKQAATLNEIVSTLRETYCREIGVEFMHIQDPDGRQWLIDRMEPCRNHPPFSFDEKLRILEKLHEAALFESFLHRRFVGQKRFSLEGGEVLMPVLDTIVQEGAVAGLTDVVLGMAHRGRLNVLAHIFKKPYEEIFAEFRDTNMFGFVGDGDVKYHRGHSAEVSIAGTRVHLTLATNPSHLEAVNPVVEGKCRARQDCYGPGGAKRVLPLLIHGDAAFAGQGSVMETLNMSELDGYGSGGTVHIVLNNQIGFTTLPRDARSTRYATDVAKMLACPIFHVHGETPESAVHVARLALEYRQTFGRDVVVELICYRRHGHNEGDEPAFTQPLMYRQIASRPPVNRIYAESLARQGVDPNRLAEIERNILSSLEKTFDNLPQRRIHCHRDDWSSFSREYSTNTVDTCLSTETLTTLAQKIAELPLGFAPHPKVGVLVRKRLEAVSKGSGIDWGNAETLAYASLLNEGVPVRISGQDCRRGTFNHRHCVLHDTNDDSTYTPLASLATGKASFQAWDSLLSEFGVLGFEYGYSLETPKCLTIWEAQFGDFANGAQVIIDQFISSGETKWNRASALVLLLPHGYEGQGAEHSSARIERYLQLCANENMVVVCPSTPSQMFHLLRRQILQTFRKPLIVFTPKSLLGHPRCVSTLQALAEGAFYEVLSDEIEPGRASRVLLCSGKLYYELCEEREKRGRNDVAIIRIEQLYPLRADLLKQALAPFSADADIVWIQEEPENMGAWLHLKDKLVEVCGAIRSISRPEDCCPAVGSHHLHIQEQATLIKRAFEA